jgi:molybdopterin-binding protein
MKYGARNQIVATVTDIQKGGMMCKVKLATDGPVNLASVMTIESAEDLGLKPGDKVRAVVKAINVLLVKE